MGGGACSRGSCNPSSSTQRPAATGGATPGGAEEGNGKTGTAAGDQFAAAGIRSQRADGQAAFATSTPRLLGQRWSLQRAWITAKRETVAHRGRQARRATGESRGGPRMGKPTPRCHLPNRRSARLSLGSDESTEPGGMGPTAA